MFVSPDTLELLAKLGVHGLDAVEVIRAFERDMEAQNAPSRAEEQKAKAAERKRRQRERERDMSRDSHAEVTGQVTDGHEEPSLSRPLSPQTPLTPTHTHGDITTPAREAGPVEPESPPPKANRATRLPPDWRPSPADEAYAASQALTRDEISRVAEDFRDFWTAKGGADGRKLDWPATWRRWVRTHCDRKRPAMASRPAFARAGHQGATDFASIVAQRRGFGREEDDVPGGGEALSGAFRVVG